MRKGYVIVAALVALLLCIDKAEAFGRKSKGNDCVKSADCCAPSSCAPMSCGPSGYAPMNCGPSGYAPSMCATVSVSYVDQEVTVMRPVTRSREVERDVTRWQTREIKEDYKYTVMEQVQTKQTRTETIQVPTMQVEKFKYSVLVPYTEAETRKETYMVPVTRPETYKVNVPVPYMEAEKRVVTTMTCVPDTVVCPVPVCRTVAVQEVDPCTGCCRTVCHKVTEMVNQTRTVMRQVPVQQEITVNVCRTRLEERAVTRMVCEMQRQERDVVVNVYKTRSEEREGTRNVCVLVPQQRSYDVILCSYQPVEKMGQRTRLETTPVTEKVKVMEYYTEMEQVKTVVKVPVYAPSAPAMDCGAPCGAPYGAPYGAPSACATAYASSYDSCCDPGCGSSKRKGLFGRR